MSVQYSPDLAALADRSDFEVSPPSEPAPGTFRRIRRAAAGFALFAGTTSAIAVVFFIPVLISNLGRVEALEIAGELVPATVFAEKLVALFWGTFVLALAFTSFVAGMRFCVPDKIVRPIHQPLSPEDALHPLTVLRLIGHER